MPPNRLEASALAGLSGPWALVGARVWDGAGVVHEAISFDADGRVGACGSTQDVLARLPRGGEIVDARDAFVAPGFVDAHLHVRAAASARLAVDVSTARGPGTMLASVRQACGEGGGWATFAGMQPDGRPHRRQLDLVSGATRVRIRDIRGHGWLLNSSALAALGIDAGGARDEAPSGVVVERGADRTPTGFVTDHVGWVGRKLGALSEPSALARAVGDWSRELARSGIVALCDATPTNDGPQLRALLEWRDSGVLHQEVTALVAPDARVDPVLARHVCGVKFGDARDDRLAGALRSGSRVAVHCVDPADVGALLDATRTTRPRGSIRIEHASFVPPDWLTDVQRIGATVVTQPSFVDAHGDRYLDDPALEPHDWLYRLRSWLDAGVPLAFGSDAPFGPSDPLRALRTAATRRTARGHSLGRAEALRGDDALRAATATAAACSGLAALGYGRLAAGGPGAAVVVADGNAALVATVIGGAVVD